MKYLSLLLVLLISTAAYAATTAPGVQQSGTVTAGHCAQWSDKLTLEDAGQTCGAGTISVGTSASTPNPSSSYDSTTGLFADSATSFGFSVQGTTKLAVSNTGVQFNSISGATQCLQVDTAGVVSGTGYSCGTTSSIVTAEQTADYTLVTGDSGNFLKMNCSSACTLTVPPNSSVAFSVGQIICMSQEGAGKVTWTAGSGVTLHTRTSLETAGQYASTCIRQQATDEWLVVGDLTQ